MPLINEHQLSREKHRDPEMVDRFSLQLTIWSNLYHRRKRRGYTQTMLAKKAQVTQTIISELENGDYNPSTEMITKLAHALDIDRSLLTKKDILWKMLETIEYLLHKVESIDVLKAMKMLYLADYESWQKNNEEIIWLEYIRRNRWPFNKAIYQADDVFKKQQDAFVPLQIKNYTILKKKDKEFLDIIAEKYGHMSSIELMKYTYQTKPMEWCTIGGSERMGEVVL